MIGIELLGLSLWLVGIIFLPELTLLNTLSVLMIFVGGYLQGWVFGLEEKERKRL